MTIAIVGAGFSGTMLAVQLLTVAPAVPRRILLIEKSKRFARGVAYGTLCPLHLLNVPARDMSAFPDKPAHFLEWAQEHDPSVQPTTFVQRRLYGKYLQGLLDDAESNRASGIEFEKIIDDVTSVEISSGGKSATLAFRSGATVEADRVVLACGNYAPGNPPISDPKFYQSPRYFQDPWAIDRIPDSDQPILLIGTGLTMVDKALELKDAGHKGTIHALSRHGLLPQIHRIGLEKLPAPFASDALPEKVSVICRALRERAERSSDDQKLDWRQIVDSVRPITQDIWKRWSVEEQGRFNRHLRSIWDIHRHRIAPDVGLRIEAMKMAGQLKIHAARIFAYHEDAAGVDVEILPRKGKEKQYLYVAAVINCTGPASNYDRISDPLILSMRKQELIGADKHRLGMDVSDNYSLKDKAGIPSEIFYTIGPPLKGLLWESVAVPELRVQAQKLASELVSQPAFSSP